MSQLVLVLFFCSGATALIYEVLWSKYLALMLGSTIQAQTVVLAVFMGGLAIGNRLFGRRADRVSQPLAIYGYLELALGLYAFFFVTIYQWADVFFVRQGAAVLDQRVLLLLLKGSLSIGLLLLPTVLMGGTLPVLASWLQRNSPDAGRRSALFYGVNSLGAVAGAGLAGFFLVQWIGLASTLQLTGMANVMIGFGALALSRRLGDAAMKPAAPPTPPSQVETVPKVAARWGAVLVALTGGVSMGLEVLASRSLSLLFGASLQSFAIMLMAFILGIGLGGVVIASPRWRKLRRETFTHVLLLAAACLIGLFLSHIEFFVELYRVARTGLARSEMGYRYHQLMTAAISMVFLGLPAGLLGSVLPLWIRADRDDSPTLGRRVGRLLTWNTVGAVAGALLTGFVLMPQAGLRVSFGVLAIVLCLAAMPTAWMSSRPRPLMVAAVVVALLVLASQSGGENWRQVLSSGIFRARELEADPRVLELRRKHIKILFYQDAADATVSVERGDGIGAPAEVRLRINGKVDATSHGDLATQYLLGHLPLLAKPDAKDVFVLGLGSGVTAGALLGHPVEHVDIAENCEPVLRAAKFFEPWNRGVLTNAVTRVWPEDARTVLKLHPRRYDVIISEPSNPWMAGVGSVFSREFYQLAASRLNPGGLMTQWFHLYEMHDGIVGLVVRTFASVFPYMELWDPGSGDIILIGSQLPWQSTVDNFARVLERSRPRYDLETIGLRTPAQIFARQMASVRTAAAIPGPGPVQFDAFPVLEYEAPKAFYLGNTARLLFQFDERTWQHELMPPAKRDVLASLPDADLQSVFAEFSTVNTELDKYVKLRARLAEGTGSLEMFADPTLIPSVFRPVEAPPLRSPVPDDATDTLAKLLRAEVQLRNAPDQWHAAVDAIDAALRGYIPDPKAPTPNWTPARFVAAAVRACLIHGDVARARSILDMGLKREPASLELQYLERLAGPPAK